jgi:putative membrane-bound dehydrogenase-like protein
MPRLIAIALSITITAVLAVLPLAASDHPLPPAEAPRHMTLPAGFRATLFAGEPDVVQPIAFTFDDRGRLWVVESLTYPDWTTEKEGHDRVLIFEDTDGDGRFDKRTVFWDKGANLSGIQVGFGGVWLCATPYLLFLPDRDGDDRPDGPPEVLLDGWDLKAKHNVFNGLQWGPDGWLYGLNGISSNSRVGKPGTPDRDRVALNCAVWRYHPTRHVFEVVASGTTNPWGLDWDDYGEMFITNCVIDHLWHVVPGAHYERMFGQDLNPHVYQLMKSCCDHIHWAGGPWQSSRGGVGAHSDFGGGHAHAGCMVYLGDNFPAEYRNSVFMCNLHGNRLNRDLLERRGPGYVAHHGPDFLLAHDPWFRGLGVQYGPDGGVYVSDWTDTGECHNYDHVDRSNGRIYKVVYGTPKPWRGDLAKLPDAELVKLQLHPNDWFVRHARRLLQERAAAGTLTKGTREQLLALFEGGRDVRQRLRALWALAAVGGADPMQYLAWTSDNDPLVRAWALRLLFHATDPDPQAIQNLTGVFDVHDPKNTAPVLLALASGAQRVKPAQRLNLINILLTAPIPADDPMLPLMFWYAIEPCAEASPTSLVRWIDSAKVPLLREFIARRLAPLPAGGRDERVPGLDRLVRWLGQSADPVQQADVLRGTLTAFAGLPSWPMPQNWSAVYLKLLSSPSAEVREWATQLAVLFGDARALDMVRGTVGDVKAPVDRRVAALRLLQQTRRPEVVPLLYGLLADQGLRGPAVRALAAFDAAATPGRLLERYSKFPDDVKADAVATLASRPAYALALLNAVEKGTVPRRDVSAYTVRQLQGLKDPAVSARLAKVWGNVRPASKEKKALIAKYKGILTPAFLKSADRSLGRQVFAKHCATCHRLFDDGERIGPELTGSQRANLDYVLENVLDPSAVVPNEYKVTKFLLTSGRVLLGAVEREDGRTVTVQTPTEKIVVPVTEIAEREPTGVSLMPEGLLEPMSREEVRDLVSYLASPAQVPLPPSR